MFIKLGDWQENESHCQFWELSLGLPADTNVLQPLPAQAVLWAAGTSKVRPFLSPLGFTCSIPFKRLSNVLPCHCAKHDHLSPFSVPTPRKVNGIKEHFWEGFCQVNSKRPPQAETQTPCCRISMKTNKH